MKHQIGRALSILTLVALLVSLLCPGLAWAEGEAEAETATEAETEAAIESQTEIPAGGAEQTGGVISSADGEVPDVGFDSAGNAAGSESDGFDTSLGYIELFISNDGNDSTADGSTEAPFATLNAALDAVGNADVTVVLSLLTDLTLTRSVSVNGNTVVISGNNGVKTIRRSPDFEAVSDSSGAAPSADTAGGDTQQTPVSQPMFVIGDPDPDQNAGGELILSALAVDEDGLRSNPVQDAMFSLYRYAHLVVGDYVWLLNYGGESAVHARAGSAVEVSDTAMIFSIKNFAPDGTSAILADEGSAVTVMAENTVFSHGEYPTYGEEGDDLESDGEQTETQNEDQTGTQTETQNEDQTGTQTEDQTASLGETRNEATEETIVGGPSGEPEEELQAGAQIQAAQRPNLMLGTMGLSDDEELLDENGDGSDHSDADNVDEPEAGDSDSDSDFDSGSGSGSDSDADNDSESLDGKKTEEGSDGEDEKKSDGEDESVEESTNESVKETKTELESNEEEEPQEESEKENSSDQSSKLQTNALLGAGALSSTASGLLAALPDSLEDSVFRFDGPEFLARDDQSDNVIQTYVAGGIVGYLIPYTLQLDLGSALGEAAELLSGAVSGVELTFTVTLDSALYPETEKGGSTVVKLTPDFSVMKVQEAKFDAGTHSFAIVLSASDSDSVDLDELQQKLTLRFNTVFPAGSYPAALTEENNTLSSELALTGLSLTPADGDPWEPELGSDAASETVTTKLIGSQYANLTYDPTSGEGGPGTVKVEPKAGYVLESSNVPTHADTLGSPVVFLWWTESDPGSKTVYDSGETPPAVALTVNLEGMEGQTKTVYAVYGYDRNDDGTADLLQLTLSYDANGGTGAPAAQIQTVGIFEIPETEPTRPYYTFAGWSKDENATEGKYKYDAENVADRRITITQDTVLYAVWQQNPVYTLYFNGNGGTNVPDPVSAPSENGIAAMTIPTQIPTRSNRTFLGWSTSRTGSAMFSPGEDVRLTGGDVTLYAIWQRNGSWSGVIGPKTGDDSNVLLYALLAAGSVAAITGIAVVLKKRRN